MKNSSLPPTQGDAPGADVNAASWRLAHQQRQRTLWFYVGLLVTGLLFCLLWKKIVITIPAGSQGVLFYRFKGGTVTEQTFGEGLYLIAPWNILTPYETRLQTRSISLKVPSEEGLEMKISVALRFRPYNESLGHLHRDIGPEYFERLILPEVHGHMRRILGKRPAHDIYTGAQNILQEVANVPVMGRVVREGSGDKRPGEPPEKVPYVILEELRVLDITRPDSVAEAVNEKQRQEQLTQEYTHRLQREQKEAERRRIEAAGIRDFRETAGVDPLRWRSVDATLELARSNNAKVVVVGSGQGTMPMMLNLGESTPGATSVPSPAGAAEPARTPGPASGQARPGAKNSVAAPAQVPPHP